jgi:hypothetical protein
VSLTFEDIPTGTASEQVVNVVNIGTTPVTITGVSIHWSPASGSHIVSGPIRDRWAASGGAHAGPSGGERGWYGPATAPAPLHVSRQSAGSSTQSGPLISPGPARSSASTIVYA